VRSVCGTPSAKLLLLGAGAIDPRSPEAPEWDVPYTLAGANESTEFWSESRTGDAHSPGIRDLNEARRLVSAGP
jgi:hypothetical protein